MTMTNWMRTCFGGHFVYAVGERGRRLPQHRRLRLQPPVDRIFHHGAQWHLDNILQFCQLCILPTINGHSHVPRESHRDS